MIRSSDEHTITVNEKVTFSAKEDTSLFTSLREAGIPVPTVCGGRGQCGRCRVKVLAGGGPLTTSEQRHLSEREIAENVRLSCQIRIRGDVEVKVPDELLAGKSYRGKCEQLRDLTHDIKLVRIQLLEPESIDFRAGQYIQLEAPAYGGNPKPVYRTYSMASPPAMTDTIELVIRLAPHGICTTWVHTILKEEGARAHHGDARTA